MDVTRIPLGSSVFEGQNNAYLVDGELTTLVDVGASTPNIRSRLLEGLSEAGKSLDDVDRILLTHWHPDHCELAGEFQAESGADVFAHEADIPLVAGDEDAGAELRALRDRRFEQWGIPPAKQEALADYQIDFISVAGDPAEVEAFSDGDRIAAGDGELTVLHLPGHAAGQVAFTFERERGGDDTAGATGTEAFVGDAILPEYTPNVGGADLRLDRPLRSYIDSLDRIIERDFDRAWPGHRDPIDDPAGRARVIREHHVDRTRRVVAALREHGPANAWTVSAHLFGELQEIHILHGPGEAYAHLNHLEHAGVVERDDWEYRLVDPDPDVEKLF